MRSFLCGFTFIMVSINMVYGATSHCNYVVDYFWTSVQSPTHAPTKSPTPAPSASPTDSPSPAPSPAPTTTGNLATPTYDPTMTMIALTINPTDTEDKVNSGGGEIEADESILKPLSLDYCYSFPDTHFYYGDFSLKYECDSNNYLVRNIYYESLSCDSSTLDTLTVQPYKQGTYGIKYVCDQSSNCDYTILTNGTATTPSPTPAPTDNPTKSPSPAPTLAPTTSPIHSGTEYPTVARWIYVTQLMTTEQWDDVGGGGGDGYWWEDCEGITAANRDSVTEIVYQYPENICVPVSLFSATFGFETDSFPYCDWGSTCSLTDLSFGWYCDAVTNQYLMGVFKDQNCENLDELLIVYTNDMCIPKIASNNYYSAYWTYIECGVSVNQPTSPTTGGSQPTERPTEPTVSQPTAPTLSLPTQPTVYQSTVSPTHGIGTDPTAPTSPTAPTAPTSSTVSTVASPTAVGESGDDDVFSMAANHAPFISTFVIFIIGLYLSL